MTEQEIRNKLWSTEYLEYHSAFENFCLEMKDRDYGQEEVNQAWYFYLSGWAAHMSHERSL